MILNVSGRCDIPAFFSNWFMNRYREGYVDTRNPFNPKLVSRIYFKNVDLIVFCSKRPRPIIKYLKDIDKPIIFHITITPYKNDIECVGSKSDIIESVKEISEIIGKDNVFIRYDPIFISDKYNLDYHIKAFKKLCSLVSPYTNTIIVSFIDMYKNVLKNISTLKIKAFRENDYKVIGENFSSIAHSYNLKVQTCFEKENLVRYGFDEGECLSRSYAYILTGKKFKAWKARGCSCAEMVDIGAYNVCKHFCKYCYANYDEDSIMSNNKMHDDNSSLLIGHIEDDDVIKEKNN